MTAHDPIADLEATARALAEGHDPAEVAARLHGIAERLRQVRTAEVERRDVLAFMATEIAKQDAGLKAFMRSDFTNAAARCVARLEILRTVSAYLDRGDHVGDYERDTSTAVDLDSDPNDRREERNE
jgi:hypothetical protein